MRTSKASRDTARLIAALSTSPRKTRSTQIRESRVSTSNGISTSSTIKQEEEGGDIPNGDSIHGKESPDLADVQTTSSSALKRKRKSNYTSVKAETSFTDTTPPNPSSSKSRRQPAKRIKASDGSTMIQPPTGWEIQYDLVKQMRLPGGAAYPAPVDTQGCAKLHDEHDTPRNQRFQTLISLMLSSQTKDTVTAAAIARLKTELPGGLNLESMLEVEATELDEKIGKVGFHNLKTKYIKQAAVILRDRWNSDIPDTIAGLTSLPGVGPKMAYLCMSAAWGRDEGIGVDVHVHRITNLWGWHAPKTKGPEETRKALEGWLPREKWHEINGLLVGLGQTVCKPVGRECGRCLLAERRVCPARTVNRGVLKESKMGVEVDGDGVGFESEVKVEEMDGVVGDGEGTGDIEDLGVVRRTRVRVKK